MVLMLKLTMVKHEMTHTQEGLMNIRRGTVYPWHDEGFKEEKRWESDVEKIDYEPPFVDIETFEIKRKEMDEDGKVFSARKKNLRSLQLVLM
nr:hypothetical protein [Tanacetum cinerariifolium]